MRNWVIEIIDKRKRACLRNTITVIGLMLLSITCSLVIMSTDIAIRAYFGPRYVEINREYYKALTPHEIELVESLDRLQHKYERSTSIEEKRHLVEAMMSIRNTLGDRIPPAKLEAIRKIRRTYIAELTQ